jgi:hypothetical protein
MEYVEAIPDSRRREAGDTCKNPAQCQRIVSEQCHRFVRISALIRTHGEQ